MEVFSHLRTAGFPASAWLCKGFGDDNKGASDRWHITSDDINPASFPLLGSLMSRQFFYGVAFHGFARQEGEKDIYIGGRAAMPLKAAVQRALNRLGLPLQIKVSTGEDRPKFQGSRRENVINRAWPRTAFSSSSRSKPVAAFTKKSPMLSPAYSLRLGDGCGL
jgi:phage replication-related protein YjqB (UPF0714/DUF867 family)